MHEKDISAHSLEEVLQKSHLPIRIKIMAQNTLLEKIEVKVLTFGAEYALLSPNTLSPSGFYAKNLAAVCF